MLLYDDEKIRNSAEIECINRGLEKGQFCIYASVGIDNVKYASDFAASITNYDKQVQDGNLLVVNFRPFYDSALAGRTDMFEELAGRIERQIAERKVSGLDNKTLIVADAACNLTKNRYFAESARLETWWQRTFEQWMKKGLDITVICAHPSVVLKENANDKNTAHISHGHSLTLDLKDFWMPANQPIKNKVMRVLVADPESDMRAVYKWAFKDLPIQVEVADSGSQCLDKACAAKADFDLIFVDTHLRDMDGIKVTEKLLRNRPNQRIVLTSTSPEKIIRSNIQSLQWIAEMPILVKPFEFTKLLSLLKP